MSGPSEASGAARSPCRSKTVGTSSAAAGRREQKAERGPERAPRDEQREAGLVRQQLGQPAPERPVAADDQDPEPSRHRNLHAWSAAGRKQASRRPKIR